jgi:hypothetical protein
MNFVPVLIACHNGVAGLQIAPSQTIITADVGSLATCEQDDDYGWWLS